MRMLGWVLGSLSPLEVLRGMTDMSLRWRHGFPLVGLTRLLLVVLVIWGLSDILTATGRGVLLSGGGVLGLFVLRGHQPE